MSLPREQAWFAAKRYGYGWSLPLRWQGWVGVVIYTAAMVITGLSLSRRHPAIFGGCLVLFTAAMIAVCVIKGEAPRWRWGDDDGHR